MSEKRCQAEKEYVDDVQTVKCGDENSTDTQASCEASFIRFLWNVTERSCESGLHNSVRSKKDITQEAIRDDGMENLSSVVCELVISCDSSAERPARVLVNSKHTENGNGCLLLIQEQFSVRNNSNAERDMFVALTSVIVVGEAHREEIIFEHPVGLIFCQD